MHTYANQKVIHIHKKKYRREFLQIGIDEWTKAYKELKASTFAVYLYLAGNTDGFDLAMSQRTVYNKLGISKSTYHRAVNELEEKGYIKFKQGNIYEFDTVGFIEETKVDKRQDKTSDLNKKVSSTSPGSFVNDTNESHLQDEVVSPVSTEIDKRDSIDKINNNVELENKFSNSPVATQQSNSNLKKLCKLFHVREHEHYKLNKLLAQVGATAEEALKFLENHPEHNWDDWFINNLEMDDCDETYEEYFMDAYKKCCKEKVEDEEDYLPPDDFDFNYNYIA